MTDRFERFRTAKKAEAKKRRFLSLETLVTFSFLAAAIALWYYVYPSALALVESYAESGDPAQTAPFENGILEITMLDVGQGDAALVKTPGGKFFLVDGGEGATKPGGYRAQDAGRQVILPYLESRKIARLDGIVLTHPDFDHGGGLKDVIEFIDVGEYLDPGIQDPSPFYLDLLLEIKKKNIPYTVPSAGQILNWDPAITVQILSAAHSPDLGNNNSSIVLRIAYGNFSILLMGDAEREVEAELVENYGDQLKCTVLKAGHHGSKTSSTIPFVQVTRPESVLISVGADNSYGHPYPGVLKRFEKSGAKIYRTDSLGTVTLYSNGREYSFRTEH